MPTYYPHPHIGTGSLTGDLTYVKPSVLADLTADISIGNRTIISDEVILYTHEHNHSLDYPWQADAPIHPSSLTIHENVYIGARAIILASCNYIARGAVIGAGSIVTKSIGPNEIWAGNPAKFLKHRREA